MLGAGVPSTQVARAVEIEAMILQRLCKAKAVKDGWKKESQGSEGWLQTAGGLT